MDKWNRKVVETQLNGYSTKRKFNHVVKISHKKIPVFQQGNIFNGGKRLNYHSSFTFWVHISHPWTPPEEIKKWLRINIADGYYKFGDDRDEYCFTKVEDAIAFKIYWSS